jgi:ubiquinone/menaquinone biosynthesis C-methylase UbiE
MSVLSRILEPEVMDSAEDALDYDTMDHRQVNEAFVTDFLAVCPDPAGRVLDVGTGTARIPIELCQRHAALHVLAVDAAAHMLVLANRNITAAGLSRRIETLLGDARHLPFPDGAFAAVISNSIIHHIPDPLPVLAEMVRLTAPGGWLFLRDLLRPRDEAMLHALVEQHAAGANPHQKQLFADSLRAALSLDELRLLVLQLGFDPLGVRQTSDRHWTWAVCKS